MIVTKVEAVTKTRYKVYLDDEFAFVLYKGELSRYGVTVGAEISENIYEKIHAEVILKRAKLRALHLLNTMGRTEAQLRQKLKQDGYTNDIVEEVVRYVKSFGYINDEEYARSFVLNRKDKKSKKELYIQLTQKGISSEIIEDIFEEYYDSDTAKDAIMSIIKRKKYDLDTSDLKEKHKMMAYLTRKGFHYEDIRRVLRVSEWNA